MNKAIKIVIGPSKTLNQEAKPVDGQRPKYLEKAKQIWIKHIMNLTEEAIEVKYGVSKRLAGNIFAMHKIHGKNNYYAIELFGGSVFKQLHLEKYDKEWINEHVLILDPLYGPLKPYDTIGFYRLDMKTKINLDLKSYWLNDFQSELKDYKVINLASKEWSAWLDGLDVLVPELDKSIKQIKKARGIKLHELILVNQ